MSDNVPVGSYAHPVLDPIIGDPDWASIKRLKQQIYANAVGVPSIQGGGNHGHLGLVMPPAEYLLLSNGVAFDIPAHPGRQVNVAGAAAVVNEANRIYNFDCQLAEKTASVCNDLRSMLIAAVEGKYLDSLRDDELDLGQVLPRDIIQHLVTTYGHQTVDDIGANADKLHAPWNPEDTIETLWKRVQDVQRYAVAAGEPIPDSKAIRDTLAVIEKTGVFNDAVHSWLEKDDADQTMANFKAHFQKQNKLRLRRTTARAAGYHASSTPTHYDPPAIYGGPPMNTMDVGYANAYMAHGGQPIQRNDPSPSYHPTTGQPMSLDQMRQHPAYHGPTDSLYGAPLGPQTHEQIATHIRQLSSVNRNEHAGTFALLAAGRRDHLQAGMNAIVQSSVYAAHGRPQVAEDLQLTAAEHFAFASMGAGLPPTLPPSYCWTHGVGTNQEHTSRTCRHRADGHQEDATIHNMMGGNTNVMRSRNRGDRGDGRQRNRNTGRGRGGDGQQNTAGRG